MNRNRLNRAITGRDLLYLGAAFIVMIALIVYVMPRESKFNYQYELNTPWRYGQLIAKFDFPIYKEDDVIKAERDSLMLTYKPYFKIKEEAGEREIRELENYNRSHLNSLLTPENLAGVQKLLSDVYNQGVISTAQYAKLRQDSVNAIMIFKGKQAVAVPLNTIFSERAAYEYIVTHGDSVGVNRDILARCDLNNFITPNFLYDEVKSRDARNDLMSSVSMANGVVLRGQKIIDRGEIVDRHTYNILESLKKETDRRNISSTQSQLILLGQIMFVAIFLGSFICYLLLFRKDYLDNIRALFLMCALIVFFPMLCAAMVRHNFLSVYILPIAAAPIIIRIFMDSRTAQMANVVIVMICSEMLKSPYDFILVQLIAGMLAIYSLKELSQRSQLVRTAAIVMLGYMVTYFAYELIHEGDITKFDRSMYVYFFTNGIFLMFTYPLLFLMEKLFGFTSNVTLVELSNINTPLLRMLSEEAPGTFQHSMQVGNLAAEVANRIGAKSQLVRTGALYHDIGKMKNPVFFTENQTGVNPHKNLSYMQSAKIVIEHVTYGLELADKYHLPQVIKDFITTHHGKGMTMFFYISYCNEHPGEDVDKSKFMYPGPNPFTLEQAILMMSDGVEAASRSLPEYTEKTISDLVDKIIDSQVNNGFFKECPITFKDIAIAKEVFKEKLRVIYHTRISYPVLKKAEEKK